jgi:cellulose synthase/poly-beta-1,6-N-acetylglucosamine synthase-like glycosyltransferase
VNEMPKVSVIVPCRNEGAFIGRCLDSVLANDYPAQRLEILVVDGMSTDGSKELLQSCAEKFPHIKILENEKKVTPLAFNLGIRHATGQVVMILGAHSTCAKDYISKCVRYLDEYNADNVGGIMKTLPRKPGLVGEAITTCLSHPFGVGGSYFRIHTDKPRWVDTVFGGCYRREVFQKIGLFNEHLTGSQDIEFNLRLKKAGGKTLLAPDIVSYYYARSDLKSFWRHNFRNGVWAVLPFLYSPVMPVRWRHLVPLAFVLGLLGSAVFALVVRSGWYVLACIVGAYAIAAFASALHVAVKKRGFQYLLIMPVVFASLHLGYGLGSVWGLTKALAVVAFKSRHAHEKSEVV